MNVFVFTLCLIGLILWFIYSVARLGVNRRDSGYGSDETELIQALNRNLVKMEQRIESLETLLADRMDSERPPTFQEVMRNNEDARREADAAWRMDR